MSQPMSQPLNQPMNQPQAPPIIEFQRVDKHYREAEQVQVVLQDLSFQVAAGETVAILGRSGSGKTSILNLMAGIDRPTAGTVRVQGQDLAALTETARTRFRRDHIGFVYQFFNLIPTLSVLENVRLPLELQGRPLPEADRRALEILDRVGLRARASSYPDRLSGGEQQRVAVARALVTVPPLILADEPTGNLDPEIGDQVLDLLRDLSGQLGQTLVLVTHSRKVASLADRVLRVQGHGVVEEGHDRDPGPSRDAGRPGNG